MDPYSLSEVPIEALYQEIGNSIARSINDDWATATLYAEIEEDDNGLTYGQYKTKQTTDEMRGFIPEDSMYYIFDELRIRMRKPGHEPWTKAKFILHRDGKFDMEFEYPDEGKA